MTEEQTQQRRQLTELLQGKSPETQRLILDMYDRTPNTNGRFDETAALTALSFTDVKNRRELTQAMIRAGFQLGSPKFSEVYDKYCSAHNLPL